MLCPVLFSIYQDMFVRKFRLCKKILPFSQIKQEQCQIYFKPILFFWSLNISFFKKAIFFYKYYYYAELILLNLSVNKNNDPVSRYYPPSWPVDVVKLWHKQFNHIKVNRKLCSYAQWYCKWALAAVRCSYSAFFLFYSLLSFSTFSFYVFVTLDSPFLGCLFSLC